MALTQGLTTSFKTQILNGVHALTTDVLYIALYTSTASLDDTTTVYTTTGEASGSGYSAGGILVTGVTVTSSNKVAYVSFTNPSWPSSTITARGALLYNASRSNASIAVLDFGADKSSSNSTFTLTLPSATYSTALIRIA
jgi:hypothetical protein